MPFDCRVAEFEMKVMVISWFLVLWKQHGTSTEKQKKKLRLCDKYIFMNFFQIWNNSEKNTADYIKHKEYSLPAKSFLQRHLEKPFQRIAHGCGIDSTFMFVLLSLDDL